MATKDTNFINDKFTAGNHPSYWLNRVKTNEYPAISANLETDVVIIGGGLAGVSTAYCCTQAGLKVVLVEDGFIASGETGRTSAHLSSIVDSRFYELEKTFGEKKTKLIAQSHHQAINFMEEVVLREGISCHFKRVDGYLFRHPTDEADSLIKELKAATKAGLPVTMVKDMPGIKLNEPALKFSGQGRFQPVEYINGLCRAITGKGGLIFTNTHAAEIDSTGITTDDGFTVKAKHVVVATNSPVNNKYAMHLKQYAYRTYVIGILVPKGTITDALWWDTGDFEVNKDIPPYHYVRIDEYDDTHDILLVGGEDHPTGNTTDTHILEEERYNLLEAWARDMFPVGDAEVITRWSGQVLEPMDGAAYIGRNPWSSKNIYIVTGISGNGMTYSTIAGRLITDLIVGNDNELEKVYTPGRLKLREIGLMFKEVMKTFLNSPEAEKDANLNSVKNGDGKLLELNNETFGVYRDEQGRLHVVSAECTHLGCLINWNNDEKSWDCPCHGSRFTYDGKVINGPANKPLQAYSKK